MAIGIRRDRQGVMPGTLTYPAAVATALGKGMVTKLDTGLLVKGAPGDVFDNVATFMVVADYVAGVTGEGGTNWTVTVIPMNDTLTYKGDVAEAGTGDAEVLAIGSLVDLNATADGFVIDDSPAPSDFEIIGFLSGEGTTTPVVEVAKVRT